MPFSSEIQPAACLCLTTLRIKKLGKKSNLPGPGLLASKTASDSPKLMRSHEGPAHLPQIPQGEPEREAKPRPSSAAHQPVTTPATAPQPSPRLHPIPPARPWLRSPSATPSPTASSGGSTRATSCSRSPSTRSPPARRSSSSACPEPSRPPAGLLRAPPSFPVSVPSPPSFSEFS